MTVVSSSSWVLDFCVRIVHLFLMIYSTMSSSTRHVVSHSSFCRILIVLHPYHILTPIPSSHCCRVPLSAVSSSGRSKLESIDRRCCLCLASSHVQSCFVSRLDPRFETTCIPSCMYHHQCDVSLSTATSYAFPEVCDPPDLLCIMRDWRYESHAHGSPLAAHHPF